jgi:branched-chain amino acid transport system substrate-binding protein
MRKQCGVFCADQAEGREQSPHPPSSILHPPSSILVALLGVFLATGCGQQSPPPPIYIGHIAPRSGVQRDYGLNAEKGILLAVEEANTAEGQVAGRPVAVLHPDSQADSEVAQSEAVRLLSVNHVAGLIGGPNATESATARGTSKDDKTNPPKSVAKDNVGASERLCRVAQQYKVPLILPTWLPVSTLGPYGFSIGMTPANQGKALGQLAVKNHMARQVAVLLDSRSPASIALAAAFTEALGKEVTISSHEYAGDDKFAALAAQVVAAKPDAILIAGNSADLEKLRAEMQQAKLAADVPMLFGGDERELLPALADASMGANELYWTTVFIADAGQPKAKEFADRYEKRFQRPADSAAAQAYDAARLLFHGIRQAKTTKGEKVRDELQNVKDFDSLTGPLSFEKGHAAPRVVFVVHRQKQRTVMVPPG